MIYMELFKDQNLIFKTSGYNQIILSNCLLQPNQGLESNYYLQVRFELRNHPQMGMENQESSGIAWVLRVQGTDTVAVVKDTQIDERRAALKKSWEDAEPGRSEKAVKARMKHELLQKKLQGDALEESESQMLNEPRMNKKQREEAAAQGAGIGKAKPGAKGAQAVPAKQDPKRGARGTFGQPEQPKEESKSSRPPPVSTEHTTNEIKAFLEHLEAPRVINEEPESPEDVYVRTEEQKEELRRRGKIGVLLHCVSLTL